MGKVEWPAKGRHADGAFAAAGPQSVVYSCLSPQLLLLATALNPAVQGLHAAAAHAAVPGCCPLPRCSCRLAGLRPKIRLVAQRTTTTRPLVSSDCCCCGRGGIASMWKGQQSRGLAVRPDALGNTCLVLPAQLSHCVAVAAWDPCRQDAVGTADCSGGWCAAAVAAGPACAAATAAGAAAAAGGAAVSASHAVWRRAAGIRCVCCRGSVF